MKKQIKVLFFLALALVFATSALAYPSFFNSRCASCHTDDSQTCNGCHTHRGNVQALVDQPSYAPGTTVTVTVTGGEEGGWIRGLLYDQNGTEVDRAAGPNGTGDNGLGSPVTFPITLQAAAPTAPGTYTWEAGWYGGTSSGSGHLEDLDSITVVVTAESGVPDIPEPLPTWGNIKALYR